MARRRRQPESSAESAEKIAAQPGPAGTAPHRWPAPLADKHWTDPQGNQWSMRGVLTARQARRLFRSPDVAVLHVHGADARQVTGPDGTL